MNERRVKLKFLCAPIYIKSRYSRYNQYVMALSNVDLIVEFPEPFLFLK